MRHNTLVLFLFLSVSLLGQSDFWPFGRGYSLEFNTSPPSLGTIPWQSVIPNTPAQLNQSTVYAEGQKMKLYFLNGSYYDSLKREIFRVPNYVRNQEAMDFAVRGKSQTLFLKNQDTLYHIFTSGTRYANLNAVPIRRFDFRRFYLSRITHDTSGYSVAVVDSFPRTDDTIDASFGRDFKVVPQDSLPLGLVFEHRSPRTYGSDNYINSRAIYVNQGRFESIPINGALSLQRAIANSAVFNPLSKALIMPFFNDTIIEQYQFVFGNNGLRFTKVDSFAISPYALLGENSETFYMESLEVGPKGRFLFMQVYEDDDRYAANGRNFRLLRIDLFGRDTLGYRDSVMQLPSANAHFKDMQFGPDGDLYYLWNKQPAIVNSWGAENRGADINNREIGRISKPLALDTSLMISRAEFGRTAPWAAFSMFPDLSVNQNFKDGFEVMYACEDSVYFRLNFGRRMDSVVWNFGDSRLGTANRSTELDPVVKYPSPGKYLVRVNLWWKGKRLHGLADSVEVYPFVHLDMDEDTILCKGDSLWLNYDQGFPAQYRWSTGDTTAAVQVFAPGWYTLEVSNVCGARKDSIWVEEIPDISPQLIDETLCQQDSFLELRLPEHPGLFYQWSTGATEPSIKLRDSGYYQAVWGSLCDTIRESFYLNVVNCSCELFVPNAFTPNRDGLNDFFEIQSSCDEFDFELSVFNRWGQLLYRQNELGKPWNGFFQGEFVPSGVYLYQLTYQGQSEGRRIEGKKSGSVMVMH